MRPGKATAQDVAPLVEAGALEQPHQLVVAALDVADCNGRHSVVI